MALLDRIFTELPRFPDIDARTAAWHAALRPLASYFALAQCAIGGLSCIISAPIARLMVGSRTFPACVLLVVVFIIGARAGHYACCVFFRRPIRLTLRQELRKMGVRTCLECGYYIATDEARICAECGASVAPLADPPS